MFRMNEAGATPDEAGPPVPELLNVLVQIGGSDLHLMAGRLRSSASTASSNGWTST